MEENRPPPEAGMDGTLWRGLSPEQRNKITLLCIALILVMCVVAVAFWQSRNKKPSAQKVFASAEQRDITHDPETSTLMEQTTASDLRAKLNNAQSTVNEQGNRVKELEKQIGERTGQPVSKPYPSTVGVASPTQQVTPGNIEMGAKLPWPAPDMRQTAVSITEKVTAPLKGSVPPVSDPSSGWLSAEMAPPPLKETPTVAKKKRMFRIPATSFADGVLIAGGAAPTSGKGLNEATPVVIRIETPAQLPGEVKRNIVGCNVLGGASGNLSTHRVTMWIKKIACFSKQKKALIEQEIDGWVVDADGREGIAGEVYAQYGETIGYRAIAEAFKSAGDILKAQSSTQTFIPTTGATTTQPNLDKMGQGMAGGAVSGGASSVAEIYAELTKMQVPYIDAGPGINVTVMFKNAVDLELKSICENEEDEECEAGAL